MLYHVRASAAFVALLAGFISSASYAEPSALEKKVNSLVSVNVERLDGADGKKRAQIVVSVRDTLDEDHDVLATAFATGTILQDIQAAALALSQQSDLAAVALVIERKDLTRVAVDGNGFPCWLYPDLCKAMDFLDGAWDGAFDFGLQDLKTLGAGMALGPLISGVIKSNPIGMAVVVALIVSEIQPTIQAEYQRLLNLNWNEKKGWSDSYIEGRLAGYVIRQIAVAWVGGRTGNELVSLLRSVASKNRFAAILVNTLDTWVSGLRNPVKFPERPIEGTSPRTSSSQNSGDSGSISPSEAPSPRSPSSGDGNTTATKPRVHPVRPKPSIKGGRAANTTPKVKGIPIASTTADGGASTGSSLVPIAVATTTSVLKTGTKTNIVTQKSTIEQYDTMRAYHALALAEGQLTKETQRTKDDIARWKNLLLHPEKATLSDRTFVTSTIQDALEANSWVPFSMLKVLPFYAAKTGVPASLQKAIAIRAEGEEKQELQKYLRKRQAPASTFDAVQRILSGEMIVLGSDLFTDAALLWLREKCRTKSSSDEFPPDNVCKKIALMFNETPNFKMDTSLFWKTLFEHIEQKPVGRFDFNGTQFMYRTYKNFIEIREYMPDEDSLDTRSEYFLVTAHYSEADESIEFVAYIREKLPNGTFIRSRYLFGKEIVVQLLKYMEAQIGKPITRVLNTFTMQESNYTLSDNYQAFHAAIKRGLSRIEAVKETVAGKIMLELGFTQVEDITPAPTPPPPPDQRWSGHFMFNLNDFDTFESKPNELFIFSKPN